MAVRALLILLFALPACRSAKPLYDPANASTILPDHEEKILAIVFRMVQDSAGSTLVSLISKNAVGGHLKSPATSPAPYCLKLQLTDGASNVLETFYTDHPLFTLSEYAGDQNQLVRKPVILKEAEFFVRVPFSGAAQRLTVEEFRENKAVRLFPFEIR